MGSTVSQSPKCKNIMELIVALNEKYISLAQGDHRILSEVQMAFFSASFCFLLFGWSRAVCSSFSHLEESRISEKWEAIWWEPIFDKIPTINLLCRKRTIVTLLKKKKKEDYSKQLTFVPSEWGECGSLISSFANRTRGLGFFSKLSGALWLMTKSLV